jgi:ankyrin repeat protein
MDEKILRNVMLGCFCLVNDLSGTEIAKEKTATIPREKQVERMLNNKLLRAIAFRDTTSLKTLLKEGANPNQVTSFSDEESGEMCSSTTPLISAIISGNVDTVRILLAKGADVNLGNGCGTIPLHAAMRIDGPEHIQRAELLLEWKANPNARDGDGCTPLMLLVDHILDLTQSLELAKEHEEENRIQGFSQGISCCFQVLKLLIDHHADIHVQDDQENTILPRAFPWHVPYLNLELVDLLIDLGADVNTQNNRGYTSIDYAIVNRNIAKANNNQELVDQYDRIIELLLKHGAAKGHP